MKERHIAKDDVEKSGSEISTKKENKYGAAVIVGEANSREPRKTDRISPYMGTRVRGERPVDDDDDDDDDDDEDKDDDDEGTRVRSTRGYQRPRESRRLAA